MSGRDGFISEDGSSFVSIKEEADVSNNDKQDDGDVDLENLPEGVRKSIVDLRAELKSKADQLASLSDKADLANAVRSLEQTTKAASAANKGVQDTTVDESIIPDFKFEEGDYYAKFLKPLADAVKSLDKQIKSLGGEARAIKASTWQEKVQTFFKSEGLPKEVAVKMDELAKSMGPGVYNDLPRLAKLAKMELGISDKKEEKTPDEKPNLQNKRKGSVEFGTSRKGANTQKQKPKSMAEAWDAAEEQLDEE